MATPCADLVHALSERLEAAISGTGVEPPDDLGRYASESLVRYDRAAEELLRLVIAGCHEGAEVDAPLWVRCIERIANLEDVPALPAELRRLRRYPALLLLYGGGLAALAAERYGTLRALLYDTEVRELTGARPAGVTLDAWQVMSAPLAMRIEGYERHHTALSDRLFDVLREPLREHLPDPADYERAFDRFEYFKGLVHVDIEDAPPRKAWIPMGRYGWSEDWWLDTTPSTVADEVAALGPQWPPLQAGLFGGSHERLLAVIEVADEARGDWSFES